MKKQLGYVPDKELLDGFDIQHEVVYGFLEFTVEIMIWNTACS